MAAVVLALSSCGRVAPNVDAVADAGEVAVAVEETFVVPAAEDQAAAGTSPSVSGPSSSGESLPPSPDEATPISEQPDPTPSAMQKGAQEDVAEPTVQEVDFRTGFAHPLSEHRDGPSAQVFDGWYESPDGLESLEVQAVYYVDLDADVHDEAVVHSRITRGGSSFELLVAWDDPASINPDERPDIGQAPFLPLLGTYGTQLGESRFVGVRAIDHGLRVHRVVSELAADAASGIYSEAEVRLLQGDLSTTNLGMLRRWLVVDERPLELEFLAGTSEAIVELPAGAGTFTFEAAADQVLSIRPDPELGAASAAHIHLRKVGSTKLEASAVGQLQVALPESAFWEVTIADAASPAPFWRVAIASAGDSPRRDDAVWRTVTEHRIVLDDPRAEIVISRPVFELDTDGRIDAAITDFLADGTDWWVSGVLEYPPLDRPGLAADSPIAGATFELGYDVTFLSDELVSVRWGWYEYVCCRPYPTTGNLAAVIDVDEARVLALNELLDLSRLDEIHDAWLDSAADALPTDFADYDEELGLPAFSSLALTPGGVEFGSNRSGPYPATTVIVPTNELDGLVRPDIAEQAHQGWAPS